MTAGENLSASLSAPGNIGFLAQFRSFVVTRQFGLAAALLSLLALVLYVFFWAPYQEFLFSDMKKYWTSALTRLDDDPFEDPQFVAWPPLYHIILAEFFRTLRWIGLGGLVRLETALTINIIVFSASVYALQRFAVRWFIRPEFVFIVIVLYALGFPSLYFNAFLLSENLAVPLMVIAFALAAYKLDWRFVLLSGFLFALATIIRPAFGPFGLAFVLFYLAHYRVSWQFIGRAAAFSAVFFGMVLLASAEVSRISNGKLFGLSGNGGLDFFINMSNYHKIDLRYDGWHFMVVAPALSWQPETGSFYTDVPFYNQDYYFEQAWKFLKLDPMRLLRGFEHTRNLFFADMLPSRPDAPGFTFWRPVWDWFKFGMFLTLGLYLWMWRKTEGRVPELVLMVSIIALTLLVSFIFTGEPRYTYSIIFIFYLLFFKLIEMAWQAGWRNWKRPVMIYTGLLLTTTAVTAGIVEIQHADIGPPSIRLSLLPHGIMSSSDPTVQATPLELDIRRARFPYSKEKEGLFHITQKYPPLKQAAPARMHTRMEVLGPEPLVVQFETYSSWPARVYIDSQEFIFSNNMDFFNPANGFIQMGPGIYDIEVIVDYFPQVGGFAIAYNYWQADGWRVRRFLGVASDRVQFHMPESVTTATAH